MESLFVILASILLLQSVLSLLASWRFARYAMTPTSGRPSRSQPKAAVIIPCRGVEPGLAENLLPFFQQDYRDYELIFVVESESDPVHTVLAKMIKQSRRSAWLVVAGEAKERGQKVHNLLAALETLNALDRRVEVLVFADSDARPTPNWLADLVAPLHDRSVGATTGFRWYLPMQATGWSDWLAWLVSAWNASAFAVLGERSGLAWGGSTAILRENFKSLELAQAWQHAVSDDYVLTNVLHANGQRIKFVPSCLVASYADWRVRELLEFTTRQMRITRVYAPRLWRFTALGHGLFNFTFWGGWFWLVWQLGRGQRFYTLTLLLCLIAGLGALTVWVRATVAARLLAPASEQILANRWRYAVLASVVPLVYLYNLLASALTRRIVWRGIGYEMHSPQHTEIWKREVGEAPPVESSPTPRKEKARIRSS